MKFEWDPAKARTNEIKHGVTFLEAATCFVDPNALVLFDQAQSGDSELRWFLIGKSKVGRVLTVRFTNRPNRIRIFGAGAWRSGRNLYETH